MPAVAVSDTQRLPLRLFGFELAEFEAYGAKVSFDAQQQRYLIRVSGADAPASVVVTIHCPSGQEDCGAVSAGQR